MDIDIDKLNQAVRCYIGYGVSSFPNEDPARLIAEFGPELGTRLEARIKSLLEELDSFKPIGEYPPILSAQRAAAELKQRHPELDPDTLAALGWIYSWWWK
jgi:hypothetical protein